MQAYEHIVASILNLKEGMDKNDILRFIERYSAYMTLPDSIRGAVSKCFGKAFRQPSHFSEGAYIKYGKILKNLKDIDKNGFPEGNIHIPEGLKTKAAEGMTNLECFKKYNSDLLNSREGQFVIYHLIQDTCSGKLFQEYIATCYIENEESNNSHFELYGVEVENGSARLNQTNRLVSMQEFRDIVDLVQKLSTLELYTRLKSKHNDITFDDITKAVYKSYDDNYPECMQNAKQYVVPCEEEQNMILDKLAGKDSAEQYYNNIKKQLVEIGAFKNIDDIDNSIKTYIDNTTLKDKRENNIEKNYDEEIR